ncbi:MAG TPA: hypothetical protein VN843_00650 [Anaerolineales bacterium]|nr:hypothetical protein [Anaerolineales bacterium]
MKIFIPAVVAKQFVSVVLAVDTLTTGVAALMRVDRTTLKASSDNFGVKISGWVRVAGSADGVEVSVSTTKLQALANAIEPVVDLVEGCCTAAGEFYTAYGAAMKRLDTAVTSVVEKYFNAGGDQGVKAAVKAALKVPAEWDVSPSASTTATESSRSSDTYEEVAL